jgi:hypothetical protein
MHYNVQIISSSIDNEPNTDTPSNKHNVLLAMHVCERDSCASYQLNASNY